MEYCMNVNIYDVDFIVILVDENMVVLDDDGRESNKLVSSKIDRKVVISLKLVKNLFVCIVENKITISHNICRLLLIVSRTFTPKTACFIMY